MGIMGLAMALISSAAFGFVVGCSWDYFTNKEIKDLEDKVDQLNTYIGSTLFYDE